MLVERRSIDVNMKVTVANGSTTNPLILASTHGYLPVVQALLQGGADVDKADNGTTPLIIASQMGHVPVVQALLQGGADVDKVVDNDCTPLIMSSQEGHVPVVQALLQGGADVDKATDRAGLWPEQPFGLIGWQGIVPCKRYIMSTKMVDVTISRLLTM
jgi:ankyrin repeat protein